MPVHRVSRHRGGAALAVLLVLALIALVLLLLDVGYRLRASGASPPPDEMPWALGGENGGDAGRTAAELRTDFDGTVVLFVDDHDRGGRKRQETEDGRFRLPPGRYTVKAFSVARTDARGRRWQAFALDIPRSWRKFRLAPGEQRHLGMGPPLTARIRTRRRGDLVTLTFSLIAADGTDFLIRRQNSSPPPAFVATDEAGKEVWRGRFEWG